EDGIRDATVTGVQTCALPILLRRADSTASLPPPLGVTTQPKHAAVGAVHTPRRCCIPCGESERILSLSVSPTGCWPPLGVRRPAWRTRGRADRSSGRRGLPDGRVDSVRSASRRHHSFPAQ